MGVRNSEELRKAHEQVLAGSCNSACGSTKALPSTRGCWPFVMAMPGRNSVKPNSGLSSKKSGPPSHAGVGLSGEAREKFNAIAKELSQLHTDFSNHVLDATKAFEFIITDSRETEGWPETLKRIAAQSWNRVNKEDPKATYENGPWRITLDYPSYGPFMEHHRNRTHREQVYRAYILRASTGELDNSGLIDRIL